MKLYDRLPESVFVDGKEYQINPSFDRVLEAFDILKNDWTQKQKIDYLFFLFVGERECDKKEKVVQAVFELLIEPGREGQKAFDFEQDAAYIYAAFMQAYNIDLFQERDRLHWWSFCALLQGLPDNTRLSEIAQIRIKPMPKATKYNAEERRQLSKLKVLYRLKTSEIERESMYQNALREIVRIAQQMQKGG